MHDDHSIFKSQNICISSMLTLQLCVVSSFACSCCLTINPCEYEVHFNIPLKNMKEIMYNIFQIIYLSANLM